MLDLVNQVFQSYNVPPSYTARVSISAHMRSPFFQCYNYMSFKSESVETECAECRSSLMSPLDHVVLFRWTFQNLSSNNGKLLLKCYITIIMTSIEVGIKSALVTKPDGTTYDQRES